MQINSFVIQVIEALRWPVVVIIIACLFRSQIGTVILRLTKLRYKNLELEFGRGLNELEERATLDEIRTAHQLRPDKPDDVALYHIAAIIPRASVMEAWRRLETALKEAAPRLDIPVRLLGRKRVTERQVISKLIDKGKLNQDTLDVFEKLRSLRNLAAHSFDYELDSDNAIRYIELALSLANAVRYSSTN